MGCFQGVENKGALGSDELILESVNLLSIHNFLVFYSSYYLLFIFDFLLNQINIMSHFFQETFPLINIHDEEEANIDSTSEFIEKEPAGLNVGISIEGLVKKFNTDAGNKIVLLCFPHK